MKDAHILIVEDEAIARENLEHILSSSKCNVTAVASGNEAVSALKKNEFDLVLTDVKIPDMDGMILLEHIKANYPDIEVIVITGYASVEAAVAAIRKGAYQYLAKPVQLDEVTLMSERALEKRRLRLELQSLRQQLDKGDVPRIVGHSESIREVRETIEQVAPVDCNILILGQTGTGKELVAKALHARSPRSKERFVAVNCASFTEELLANELFGHEREAFTGAEKIKHGLLEVAHKGSFFLDEVGDMALPMQANLLRVLQSKTLLRVGGTTEIPVDVRVIAATNRDLKAMVETGDFRRDLYYRLNVISLHVPTLAERREDIPLLANFFRQRYAARFNKNINEICEQAMDALFAHDYPGNIRELENIIERAVVLCNTDRISLGHLPGELRKMNTPVKEEMDRFMLDRIVDLDELERSYLSWALEQTKGNKSKAAELLGLNRGSLWRKLKRHGLSD